MTEVAEVLRVSPRTVQRWIVSGDVKAMKLPSGRYRIPRSEVERLSRPAA